MLLLFSPTLLHYCFFFFKIIVDDIIYEDRNPTNKTVIDTFNEEPDIFELEEVVPRAIHKIRIFIEKFLD
ncbi:MAG: hypothetical protein DRG78_07220 [Epsilonproteobacteria bacterium]|nr:MAG: hypothetical protein DRG78_07220 [Campylobacterota bacterium]